MLIVKSVLACQCEVNGWGWGGGGVEGHRDIVDLEMCSKINTKGNNAKLHFFTVSQPALPMLGHSIIICKPFT